MPPTKTMAAARRAARTLPVKLDRLMRGEEPWPRLSETISGPRHPERCQKCGRWRLEIQKAGQYLQWWQECAQDESYRCGTKRDRLEAIYIGLCTGCNLENKGIVYRHPRFYKSLPTCSPTPGIMALCIDCAWRDGTHCSNPAAKHNGGYGLVIEHPEPISFHMECSPRSLSGTYIAYPSMPTACSGREELEASARFDEGLFAEGDFLPGDQTA